MEDKTNAIVVTIVVLILLFIIIAYKLRSDKQRKSLAVPNNGKIKPNLDKSFLATTPSFVLAIITLSLATILLFGIGEGLGKEGLGILKGDASGILASVTQGLVIAISCYFIVKHNPRSIWYVPVICNLIGIMPAIVEPGFWKITSWWGIVCGSWGLSIIASIIGALSGRKKTISVDQ